MNSKEFLTLVSAAVGLSFSFDACAAKEVKISLNNTVYPDTDVQELAATAVGMGVKEPASLNSRNGVVTVSDSSATKCAFKVGDGNMPQIQGVGCK